MSDSNIVDVDRYIDIRQDKEGKESAGNARGQRRGRLAKDGHTSPGKARRARRAPEGAIQKHEETCRHDQCGMTCTHPDACRWKEHRATS